MRVFVTGAAGFVGRVLVARLEADGMEVATADREVDVADFEAVRAAVEGHRPDAIVHLAAVSWVPDSFRDPLAAARINYLGSRNVLEAVRRFRPAARVLLVGSSDQYPTREAGAAPLREGDALCPGSPYARSKAAAELLGGHYARAGLDVVRVRAFTHIGPGQSDRFVASSFARQVAEIARGAREPRMQVGNLDSVRDFLDVADVADAYARLLAPAVPARVYNVASGQGVRVGELLELLFELAGVAPRVERDPARYRPTDCRVGDASRLRKATGWAPRTALRSTLAGLLDYWRARA